MGYCQKYDIDQINLYYYKNPMKLRLKSIEEEIKTLHDNSLDECMRKWWFKGHVLTVMEYVKVISQEKGGNTENLILAALFHDIARAWGVINEPQLMNESLSKSEEIMKKYNYSNEDIQSVKNIIKTHSCRDSLPESLEGKILSTADALAHFFSDLYFILPFNGWFYAANDYDGYKKWLLKSIEKNFNKKIFFEDYKILAKPRYDAIKMIFTSH